MGATAFNNFFDYWRGTDSRSHVQEADKVLLTEGVPALVAFFIAVACYAVAAVLGLLLAIASVSGSFSRELSASRSDSFTAADPDLSRAAPSANYSREASLARPCS